ncbi:MAG: YdcH family protein [Gammaproteobacteria bacterium]|nr:YdcH family protein [Gammaproteobacteria bacterium]MBT8063372.1 YdcH family protein [Gammaproteobacteria bacterium]NNK32235.1 YdcH family protein [Xanthomonadales bacterium]
MFEHHQEQMEKLMKDNEEFLRIYNRHQELDKRVTAAETGTAPMEDLALNQLKKEKLWAKDQLARIMDQAYGS